MTQEEQYCENEQNQYLGDKDISSGEREETAVTNAVVAWAVISPVVLQILFLSQARAGMEPLRWEKESCNLAHSCRVCGQGCQHAVISCVR